MKSKKQPGIFSLISPNNEIIKLNFLQSAKIFKSSDDEIPVKIHDSHFDHVNKALLFYKENKNIQQSKSITKKHLSPEENKAISNISALLSRETKEENKIQISACLEAVKKGKFMSSNLPKQVNKFFKSHGLNNNNYDNFIDLFFKDILSEYNFHEETYENEEMVEIIEPQIVLTESFI